MSLKLIVTKDGSHTIQGAGGVTYHSTFGAIQESMHIFINAGLRAIGDRDPIRIFELGLGTGLNALLTLLEAADKGRAVYYEAVETEPLAADMAKELNYCSQLVRTDCKSFFERLHGSSWETPDILHPGFTFFKTRRPAQGYLLRQPADLVYYDAFDPATQPELWTPEVFQGLYGQLAPGALLVTYCCKGVVQRALRSAGFAVEKLPGPPGKREILRARKP
jgi:tRNA U34 5-methylaminomethyl-2-thiouridine-forming methyltransferase MnmC